jgi:hypothetical protein
MTLTLSVSLRESLCTRHSNMLLIATCSTSTSFTSTFTPSTPQALHVPPQLLSTNNLHQSHAYNAAEIRSQPRRPRNDRLPLRLRTLPRSEPIHPNAQSPLGPRMQDLYPALHSIPVVCRPYHPQQKNQHLLNLRPVEELLSMLYA